MTASVYADGLTAAVGIAPTSSIRVARHVIDPRRSPVRGVANLCRRPGRRHRPGPWMLPRHRSPPFATSSIRGRVRRYADGLAVGIPLFFILFTFSWFFSQHKCALSNKKTYPDGISIAPLTDVAAAVPHSDAGEGGTPRSCVPGACASHHASTTVGGPKATPSGIATPPGTPSRLTGPSYMRGGVVPCLKRRDGGPGG